MNKVLKNILCMSLVASMALAMPACNPIGGGESSSGSESGSSSTVEIPDSSVTDSSVADSSGSGETGGDVVDASKTVSKLEIVQKPDKLYYEVGDEFTVEGGIVKVVYTDGTSQELPMTSSSFTVAIPSMSAVGTKNINVKIGTKKCTFTIKIAAKSFQISYHYNYEGAAPETVTVVQGDKAENKTPVREGYTFVGWYANSNYMYLYDFDAEKGVQADAFLYARWSKNGVAHYTVTFDHNYYGDLYQTYSYQVDEGDKIEMPSAPVRFGYNFVKWLDEAGNEYDFSNTTVSSDVKLTASWEKTITGMQTYVFEAEDTDLTNKVGPAFSGTCSEEGMIVPAPADRGCSNGRFVSYLYRNGNSLEFCVAADEDLTDVTIYARLSAELRDYTYTPDNFAFYLNGEKLNYSPIVFTGVPISEDAASALDCLDFQDFLIAAKVTLKKGENLIRLVTENSDPMEGTTLEAAAPIVDCIKLETTGVVIWDANYKLPFAGNY